MYISTLVVSTAILLYTVVSFNIALISRLKNVISISKLLSIFTCVHHQNRSTKVKVQVLTLKFLNLGGNRFTFGLNKICLN